ncbi:MAG TPA: alpha-amylase domain-containing protein [Nitrospira sp.]|nr:alpha-amylase domain-containing protein [Nitrospira sp.]
MGVMMQAFYWDCPRIENKDLAWWNHVKIRIPSLSANGFTALWLPPVSKAANIGGMSMGYDPYDYYDLGDIDQKGSVKTWFGSKDELAVLIREAHDYRMQVYADLVLNHNNGADAQETNPIDHQRRWTDFAPKSGKFPRDWRCFHPSPYETWDRETFGDMPDLCHRNPCVYTELIEYAKWLIEEIGFDGFRYDCVKGYGGWMVRAIQELRGMRDGAPYKPFGVGECWDSERTIQDWLDETNAWSDNPASAFDFPLRYALKDLCQTYGYSLKNLVNVGTLLADRPSQAVTFVENHDVVRGDSIVTEKMLAYAFILTHEGYPCVFWQDYYNWGLAREGDRSGIAELVRIHEAHAGGSTSVLYVDEDLYIMQRGGWGDQRGLIFVLNNRGEWNGGWVGTQWKGTRFIPAAWRGRDDAGIPAEKTTRGDGWGEFWAPPRGYAVYIPQV